MKGGCCDGDPPVCVLVSPSSLCGGLVEWRGVCCVMGGTVRNGGAAVLILPSDIEVLLSCSRGGFVEGRVCVVSYCEWVVSFSSPLCVHCHSIVGLGWCLCGRVVSLWDSGGGLCGGGRACGMWCLLSAVNSYVLRCVCFSVVCVLSCCAVLWVVEWRWGGLVAYLSRFVFLLSFPFLFFFVLVFGVVRAQLCEHARYPRTPLCSFVALLLCLFLFSSAPRLSSCPAFLLLEWRCVFTMCRCA